MTRHSVCDFVTQNDGQRRLVLCDRQQTFVDYDFSARHTERVGRIVLHEVKLPVILLQLFALAVLVQISRNRICQSPAYAFDHRRIVCVGRKFGCSHILLVLFVSQTHYLFVRYQKVLLTSCNGDGRSCAAAYQEQDQRQQD